MTTTVERCRWFAEARFGMHIHWGLYSLLGRNEWVMHNEKIPVDEYATLARRFNPRRYNPDAWTALARDAGMRYMVLTTRHHDGFCLFDTRTTDFNAVRTAAQRDLVAEYVRAVRRAGLKVGLYYSLGEWRHPAMYRGRKKDPRGWADMVARTHAQVEELCTNYGRIDLLWYDGGFRVEEGRTIACELDYDSKRLNAMVRRHQPHILINDRTGLPEDFDTPEQRIVSSQPGRLWESCMTINRHWGYTADDTIWKSAREIAHNLTACACGGGNYLLNVGPKADGTIPSACVTRLRTVGAWLRRNGEAIYGAGPSTVPGANYGVATARGKRVYLFVHWWPGRELKVPNANVRVRSACILSTKQKVRFEVRKDDLYLRGLPSRPPDPLCPVIALEIA